MSCVCFIVTEHRGSPLLHACMVCMVYIVFTPTYFLVALDQVLQILHANVHIHPLSIII